LSRRQKVPLLISVSVYRKKRTLKRANEKNRSHDSVARRGFFDFMQYFEQYLYFYLFSSCDICAERSQLVNANASRHDYRENQNFHHSDRVDRKDGLINGQ